MNALAPLLALAATTLLLAPATAQSVPAGAQSQIVHYGDLDLARPEGVRALDRRLKAAIDQACGPASAADPVGTRMVRECRATLRAELGGRRAELLAGIARDTPIVVALAR
jgi:UrcA family protein